MMHILVTGASGFMGKFLCRALEKQGHNVISLDSKSADLTKPGSLQPFNAISLDRIYHLAAWTQAGDFCLHHPAEQWIINQKINTHVLDWWATHQSKAKLIAMGTSCSYAPDSSLKEENYLIGDPIDSLYTYAMTKRMLYVGLKALHRQYGLNYLYCIPSTLYGPDYHTDGRQMHFIFDLMRKIIRGKLFNESVSLWGDGFQKRELVLADDFVSIVLNLDTKLSNTLINIGAGEEHTIRYFAKLISSAIDYDFELIQFDESKYTGAKSKCLDTKKLHQVLPNTKMTPLKEGLMQTIEWFMANIPMEATHSQAL